MVSVEGQAADRVGKDLQATEFSPTEASPPLGSQEWYCPNSTQRLQHLLKNPDPFFNRTKEEPSTPNQPPMCILNVPRET